MRMLKQREADEGFTDRVLRSLDVDMQKLTDAVENMRGKMAALSKRRGVESVDIHVK